MKKVVGIFICMLLICSTITVTGEIKDIFTRKNNDIYVRSDSIINPLTDDNRWVKIFGGEDYDIGRSVQQTSDNGYILVGGTEKYGVGKCDIWLIKLDEFGNEEWNVTFGGLNYDYGFDVKQTNDGGYILVGNYNLNNGSRIIKTDDKGNLEWDTKFLNWKRLIRVSQTDDNGYILVGYIYKSDPEYDESILLLKINEDGNEEWNRSFSYDGYIQGFSVSQSNDGGYILTGGCYIIKTDVDGLEEWILEYDEETRWNDVMQNSDGGFTVVGFKGEWLGNMIGYMLITDGEGNVLNSRKYRGIYTYYGPRSIDQTDDGGYIVTGEIVNDFPLGSLCINLWLAKTDESGKIEWSKRFGGDNSDYGWEVQQTIDGGYIVVGGTNSFGSGNLDVWLIKTDENGKTKSKVSTSFGWIKSKIFFNCHVKVTADEEKGVAEVGNAPPILVWSTESGTVEITTPFRHKTLTGRTKGIVIYSAGSYGNDPFFIDRDAVVCIVATY